MAYFEQSGHCTRCGEPFGGNRATAFMVREDLAWAVYEDRLALTQRKVVAVCEACATPSERANATISADCKGCGISMLSSKRWRVAPRTTCSTRCAQRWLRLRRRQKRLTCTACGLAFAAVRADAKFCSKACRQKAHRLSRHPTPPAAAARQA